MKSIVLIGMMGCGKTTCARILAKSLNRQFVDTDVLIEAQAQMSVAEIFQAEGEGVFRDWETKICCQLAGRDDLIIATGGGLILREENVKLLQENGFVVFLNRPAEEIYDAMTKAERPLAQDGRGAFLQRFSQREPSYLRAAQWVVTDFSGPEATAEAILKELQGREGIII